MINASLSNFKILGLLFIISLFITPIILLIPVQAQEGGFTTADPEEPKFKIINIPNEGIVTLEIDSSYKNQMTVLANNNQTYSIEDAGEISQIGLTGREDGSIILADVNNHKIQKFDSNGTLFASTVI